MPHPQRGHLVVDRSEGWSVLAAEGQDIGSGRSVVPTLDAVKTDVGRLTLARAVDFEFLEDDLDNEVVDLATADLVSARDLVPISCPALVVCPGPAERAARAFAPRGRRTLVLVAIDESGTTSVHR